MDRGERALKVIAVCVFVGMVGALLGWGIGRSAAGEEPVGRYQIAAPDLVLDTATGRLTTSQGEVLESAIDPSGDTIGRFAAAGWVSAVTRSIGLNMLNHPVANSELVKAYTVVDTRSGQVVRQRVYSRQPLQPTDL